MQFTTLILASLAAVGVMADLHSYAWCADREFDAKGAESNPENNDVTVLACTSYRNRNTGSKWWDTCPDCAPGLRGDVRVCNSPAKHIGGDEWNYYCKLNGADMGKAS